MTTQEVELFRQLVEKVNRLERRIGLADTLELASGGGVYTNEEAQDAVGTILTDTATIDFTYTDATPTITADVKNDSITFAKMQNIATDSLIGRDTASSGDPENITLNATLSMTGAGALQRAALTGDVTASAGSNATTIANDAVTNAKAANMAADTIKGRANGAGTGDPTDLTATQVRTIINVASGADVTGTAITALATKTTPVDADAVVITDSAASDAPKRTTWANIKATLKTYLDTLYVDVTNAQTVAGIKRFSSEIRTGNSSTIYLEQKQAGVTITNSTWTSVLTGLTGVSIVYFQLNSNSTNFGGVFYIINNGGTITITPIAVTNMVAGAPTGFQVGYQASTTALQMQAGPSWPATIGCNIAACRLVW